MFIARSALIHITTAIRLRTTKRTVDHASLGLEAQRPKAWNFNGHGDRSHKPNETGGFRAVERLAHLEVPAPTATRDWMALSLLKDK